jgi:hypothetical protein
MNGARSHPRNRRSRFSGKRPTEQTGELTGLCVAGEVDPGAVVELRRRAAHTDRVLAGGDRPLAPGWVELSTPGAEGDVVCGVMPAATPESQ